jgi:hypothetical protein
MADRINLRAYRSFTTEQVTLSNETLLALVEAVEAAHGFLYGEPDVVGEQLDRTRLQRRLILALENFDFVAENSQKGPES